MNDPVGLGENCDLAVLILTQFVEDYRYPSGCGSLAGKPLDGEMKKDLVGFIGDWILAETDEDREEISRCIRETLDGPKGGIAKLF